MHPVPIVYPAEFLDYLSFPPYFELPFISTILPVDQSDAMTAGNGIPTLTAEQSSRRVLMHCRIMLWVICGLTLLAGCTVDNVRRGIYDGVRVRNDLQSTPAERVGTPQAPDFSEYERLRKEPSR